MTLLIADDERVIREGIASGVDWKTLGFDRVLQASNGKKTLALIRMEKPDIAIVDILMPEMTGMEVIAECRKSGECPEFIIISGHDEFKYAQEALRNNVRNYLLKPCNAQEIAAAVKAVAEELERRRSMEADRRKMQERLDILEPQARDRLFREFISGEKAAESSARGLKRFFGREEEAFRLLVLYCGEPEGQREIPGFKTAMENRPGLNDRLLCAALRDSFAAVFPSKDRSGVEQAALELGSPQSGDAPIFFAAVSAPGPFESLPQLYHLTHETARRASLLRDPGAQGKVLETSASPYSPVIQKAMRYAEGHFADGSLSLGKAAKEVLGLNPDYVGKLFKKECGLTFGEYVNAVRMEQAKRILAASEDVRVYEAAWQVGFGDDAAYFSQVFRKYAGVPPGEYRKLRES